MINAVIFDMDGVISDTVSLHMGVEAEVFRKFGIELGRKELLDADMVVGSFRELSVEKIKDL